MRQLTFKMPNELIGDTALPYSARRVAAVLYAHKNALGSCHKTYAELAQLSGLSPATVRKAVIALSERGYIAKRKTYRYAADKRAVIYGKTEYHCSMSFKRGYTLIPREIFKLELSDSAFSVLLYIFRCMPRSGKDAFRAHPSIQQIERITGAARSTVCLALRALKQIPMILAQLCRKVNGAFGKSSYYLVKLLDTAVELVDSTLQVFSIRSYTRRVLQRLGAAFKRLGRWTERVRFFEGRGSPKFSK